MSDELDQVCFCCRKSATKIWRRDMEYIVYSCDACPPLPELPMDSEGERVPGCREHSPALPPYGTEEWRRATINRARKERLRDDFIKLAEGAD